MPKFTARRRRRPRQLGLEQLETRAVPATYFVATSGDDQAAGLTVQSPLRTIQHALDVATSPVDVVAVRGGVYHERLAFKASGSASGGAIVLKNYGQEKPVLDGTGLTGGNMILLANRSYIQVSGFEIRNLGGVRDGSAIRVVGHGSHIVLRGNVIHDIRGKNAMGITVYGTSPTSISHLVIDRNQIFDCQPAPSEALTLNGNVAGFSITNNLVHDVNNIGIDVIGGERSINPDPKLVARSGVVRGNTVYHTRSNYGGGYAGGIYVDGGRDVTIENNTSYENDLGIEIGAENAGIVTSGIVVRNNLIHHNDKAGIVFGGYAQDTGRVRNSYFAIVANDTLGGGNGQLWIQYASGNVVANNIFAAGPNGILVSTGSGDVNNVVDYNMYYAPAGANDVQLVWHDSEYSTFGGYRNASGDDSHSKFAAPRFVAPANGNYHLTATSPAVDAGTSHANWFAPTDREGIARPVGSKPDLGEFEYHAAKLTQAAQAAAGFTERRRADQLVSVFENDTIVIQYDYIENIHDGRGYTAGRAGYTTATGDFLDVVEDYTDRKPNNPLAKYLPRLRELAEAESASTAGLAGIIHAWEAAASDAVFKTVQDAVVDREYYLPARRRWESLGMHSALSLAILYDTIIQHGGGSDPDGLPAIVRRTNAALGGSPATGVGERRWMSKFLDIRYAVLSNATDPATREEWRNSRPRADILRILVEQKNWDLHGPIHIPGTHYTAVTIQ